jgi:hypothetical protein
MALMAYHLKLEYFFHQPLQVKNPMTMTEKILANHSDNKLVRAAAAAGLESAAPPPAAAAAAELESSMS